MLGFAKKNNTGKDKIVWSCNEWDPLEEVIVGRVEGAIVPSWDDVAVKAIVPDHAKWFFEKYGGKPFPQEMIDKAAEELEGLVNVLQDLGIVVHRPQKTDYSIKYTTPWWESKGLYCAMPRDVLLVIGDMILEAPMAWRSRYFESFAFRPLIKSYFERGARWMTAPKSSMNDDFYNKDYNPDVPRVDNKRQFVITEEEVAFDAADFLRLGKDIVVQKSNVTNQMGIDWVKRHIDSEYTIHQFEFGDENPMHIDTTIVPLAPGLLLINPSYVDKDSLPDVFSNWKIIEAPSPSKPYDSAMYFSSDWLTINFLIIGHKKAIVEENETELIELLKENGFEIIPIPFRNFYPFGGSIHCATADIRRKGPLKSYR